MDISRLESFLKDDLKLSKKQVEIINALSRQDLTAPELCKTAKVPLGRIYSYLNELIRLELAEKTSGVPSRYSIKSISRGVTKALDASFNAFLEKRRKIASLVEQPQETVFIDSKIDLTNELIKIWYESGRINAVYNQLSVPLFLYQHDKQAFLEDRQFVAKDRDTIIEAQEHLNSLFFDANYQAYVGGARLNYVACKHALDFYFNLIKKYYGREELRKRINEIKENMKRFSNVKIRVLDEPNILHFYVTQDKTIVTFARTKGTIAAIVSFDKKLIKFYQNLFENMLARTTSFESYLRGLKI
ncbi:hypothetical protein HZB89_00010 [archaeon]|nr:hypothetical protein [archaeon]